MKNEEEARADPGSELQPPARPGTLLNWDPSPAQNDLFGVLGRLLNGLRRARLERLGAIPFFSFKLIPKPKESPPPYLEGILSRARAKGLLSGEDRVSTEGRVSSRELANTPIHLPSQSQISHEFPQLSHGGVDRRSNRDILLSVERSLSEKVSFAGSREPTPLWKETELEKLRKEAMDLRILLAGYSSQDFPILLRFLQVVSETPMAFFWYSYKDFRQGGTDTPDPGEETISLDPNPVQGDAHGASLESPSPGTTGETEGERR